MGRYLAVAAALRPGQWRQQACAQGARLSPYVGGGLSVRGSAGEELESHTGVHLIAGVRRSFTESVAFDAEGQLTHFPLTARVQWDCPGPTFSSSTVPCTPRRNLRAVMSLTGALRHRLSRLPGSSVHLGAGLYGGSRASALPSNGDRTPLAAGLMTGVTLASRHPGSIWPSVGVRAHYFPAALAEVRWLGTASILIGGRWIDDAR